MDQKIFSIKDFKVKNKIVIIRTGFDVLNEKGEIKSTDRIEEGIPTIKYLISKDARIILITHNGRPEGKFVPELSSKNLITELTKRIGKVRVCTLEELENEKQKEIGFYAKNKEIVLLENIRFYPGEEENNKEFAKRISALGDYYVNDAFSDCHREHASITGVTSFIPTCAGILLHNEIIKLAALDKPKKPYIAIIGGKKLDKINLIKSMLKKAEKVVMVGGLIFTLYKAKGLNIGKSIVDCENLEKAKSIDKNKKIYLPSDVIIADKVEENANVRTVKINEIKNEDIGVDIGPKSCEEIKELIKKAKTISWNGPAGIFEIKKFSEGTKEIVKMLAKSRAKVIIGGGDTAKAYKKFSNGKKVYHISTGGGASLEYMEKETLVGIKALEKSYKKFGTKID